MQQAQIEWEMRERYEGKWKKDMKGNEREG